MFFIKVQIPKIAREQILVFIPLYSKVLHSSKSTGEGLEEPLWKIVPHYTLYYHLPKRGTTQKKKNETKQYRTTTEEQRIVWVLSNDSTCYLSSQVSEAPGFGNQQLEFQSEFHH